MYKQIPHENWLQKGLRVAEGGLKIYGTAKGLYDAGVCAGYRHTQCLSSGFTNVSITIVISK